jgi:hypothetical protein
MWNGELVWALGPVEMVVIVVMMAVFLVPQILYLITLQNLMKKIAPHNQQMTPGQVWLMFIPFFSLVWMFIMVGKISDSLSAEFKERGIVDPEDKPGYSTGMWYCGLTVGGIIPLLGYISALAGLVLWIMYWVKMNNYSQLLSGDIGGNAGGNVLDAGQYVKD